LSNPNIDETQMRVIGSITVVSDQPTSLERQIGSVGLIVVSDNAIAAGAASIPGPSTDIDNDGWFCHTQFAQNTVANPTASLPPPYAFVSKGRRIVQEGMGIAIMVENIHATHGMIVALQFRMLSRVTGT